MTTKPDTEQSEAFPVHWDDPADATQSWNHDPMHAPDVMSPLGFDLFFKPFFEGFGAGGEAAYRAHQANYYVYHNVGAAARSGQPSEEAHARALFGDLASAGARWRNEVLPEVKRLTAYYLETDFDAMTDADLTSEIGRLREVRVRQGTLHTMAMRPWGLAMNILIDIYCQLTGGDELGAVRLVQGHGSKSVEVGRELWRLAGLARSVPGLRDRFGEVNADTALTVLHEMRGRPELAPFLDSLFDVSGPVWLAVGPVRDGGADLA